MKTNVLLAEGRKLVREGLCALLERHEGISVVGEAADVASAAKLCRALPVHVVVLNLVPPALGGAEAVRALARASKKRQVRVVVLTLSPDAPFVAELLEAGAAGCLTKDAAAAELVEAIRTAKSGKVYLSPGLMDVMVKGYAGHARAAGRARRAPSRSGAGAEAGERALAARERLILQRIAAGETTKEIAAALGVSSKTVETHRRRIMRKLNRHSVAELTKYAVLQGITPLEPSA